MCPACLTTAAVAVAGAASAGGLTALVLGKLADWVDAQIAVERRQEGACSTHASEAVTSS